MPKHETVGTKVFRLTVTSEPIRNGKHYFVECRCDCGRTSRPRLDAIRAQKIKSCGCLSREMALERLKQTQFKPIHGKRHTKEWKAWNGIVRRCTRPGSGSCQEYGRNGITVAPEFIGSGGFERFYGAIGPAPTSRHTVDRIDGNNGYTSDNIRWATRKEQARNLKSNRMITFDGRSKCLAAWAEETGLKPGTISARLSIGWSVERSLTTPVKQISPTTASIRTQKDRATRVSGTREWRCWWQMVRRCTDPNSSGYPKYGAVGVKIYPEWLGKNGFKCFLEHIGLVPSQHHTIDRKDPTGNYVPGNVKWSTLKEQARNRRNNHRIGSVCLSEYAEIHGFSKTFARHVALVSDASNTGHRRS
jgi:hypothetical protein